MTAGPAEPVRVLVADDSRGVRELLVMLLSMEPSFTVVGQARDGVTAVSLAQKLQPDLVLLDVSMPRLDGIEALPQMRAVCPGSRVVIFSGDTDQAMEGEAKAAGALAVIAKSDIAKAGTATDAGAAGLIDKLRELISGEPFQTRFPRAGSAA